MRTTKRQSDFSAVSRRSIQKDFQRVQSYAREVKRREIEDLPEINSERRAVFVGKNSEYYQHRACILGKLFRLVERAGVGGWICEFVHDEDRQVLNAAAGWTDNKTRYLLDGVKFK